MGKTIRRMKLKRGKIIGDSDPEYGKKNLKKTLTRNESSRRHLNVKKAREIVHQSKAA